jgi:DNA-binding NarL/FixJ family response regulator
MYERARTMDGTLQIISSPGQGTTIDVDVRLGHGPVDSMINVLVVEDNPIVRSALRDYLDGTDEAQVVAEAGDGRQALAAARRLRPAVTLLDYRMPIADGLSVITELSQYSAVLVLTTDGDPELVARMLRGGARGYLVHGEFDPAELLRAVRAVAGGRGWLSPGAAAVAAAEIRDNMADEQARRAEEERQRDTQTSFGLTQREQDVLALLSEGLSNAAIADRLVLTEKTVKNLLNHIFAKLQVTNRTEAILRSTGHQ